ncbi:cytochrome o ubiquinol oxidase subunit IV, partial [Paracoccus siganidrum]
MSAEHAHPHDDHSDQDHGSHASYLKGFVLSVILTAIPFGLVMAGGFENRTLTALLVMGFAIAQILVHMVFFLHMNGRQEQGWTLLSTIFTVIVVVIMLAGSLWVMYHLNTNMMPQMNHDLQGFG